VSLTSFVKKPEVRSKLAHIRPKISLKISAPLQVPSRSKRYSLVGTAFDYLLRFEIQRRAPFALTRPWIAEKAADIVYRQTDPGAAGMDLLYEFRDDPKLYLPPEEIQKRARAIVAEARAELAVFCKTKNPSAAMRLKLATHAIRLAKLDSIFRAKRLEPQFERVEPEDAREVVDLLAIVPFDNLLDDRVLILNPTLGEASRLVGGADADLVSGDSLIDVKVTANEQVQNDHLDQLLGYFILWRYQREADAKLPEIRRVGIYFARHGYLWTVDAREWTGHPDFQETEQWFMKRAKEDLATRRTVRS
jgi:hypothetical protein